MTSAAHLCLVIERRKRIALELREEAHSHGLRPFQVADFESAREILRLWRFDGIVLDSSAFGPAFMTMLPQLRPRWPTPLVLLSQPLSEREQIAALASGATDVVPMPASTPLIAAKVRQLIEIRRPPEPAPAADVKRGALVLCPASGGASIGDRPLALTAYQFDLLTLLALRDGPVSRLEVGYLLGRSSQADARVVDVQVCRIRRKLADIGDSGLELKTVRGLGYRLQAIQEPARQKPSSPLAVECTAPLSTLREGAPACSTAPSSLPP